MAFVGLERTISGLRLKQTSPVKRNLVEAISNPPVNGMNVLTKDNSSTENKQTKYSSSKTINQNVQKKWKHLKNRQPWIPFWKSQPLRNYLIKQNVTNTNEKDGRLEDLPTMPEVRKENRFILPGVQTYAQNLSLHKETLIRSLTSLGVKLQTVIKLTSFPCEKYCCPKIISKWREES